jgi:hypothetical protein
MACPSAPMGAPLLDVDDPLELLDEPLELEEAPPLSRGTAEPTVFPFEGREPSWAQTGNPARATTPHARVTVPKKR